jgi:hypothetical protein
MSNATHWPGPFTLRKRRDGSYNVYCASHDVALAVHRDNAPLLRAAPELYRALREIVQTLEAGQSEPELCKIAHAALAQAADGLP